MSEIPWNILIIKYKKSLHSHNKYLLSYKNKKTGIIICKKDLYISKILYDALHFKYIGYK